MQIGVWCGEVLFNTMRSAMVPANIQNQNNTAPLKTAENITGLQRDNFGAFSEVSIIQKYIHFSEIDRIADHNEIFQKYFTGQTWL